MLNTILTRARLQLFPSCFDRAARVDSFLFLDCLELFESARLPGTALGKIQQSQRLKNP